MSPSLAVVLATYNGERFLPAQLQSFVDQARRPDVLVVSDDGSTDGTLAVLREFAARAPFSVRISQNPRQLGYGENFLSACAGVNTDLVAFADQDDIWLPPKLALSCAEFERPQTMLAVHAAQLIDAEGRLLGPYTQGITSYARAEPLTLDPWGFFSGFTMTVRRSLLEMIPAQARGLDMNKRSTLTAHDRWVYFLASCFGEIAMIPEPLALYRQHGGNLYGGQSASRARRVVLALREQSELLQRASHYRNIARHRADLLRRFASEHADVDASQLDRSIDYWDRIAQGEQNRLSLYGAERLSQRFRLLVRNLSNGTYRTPLRGEVRLQAVARDTFSTLVPP